MVVTVAVWLVADFEAITFKIQRNLIRAKALKPSLQRQLTIPHVSNWPFYFLSSNIINPIIRRTALYVCVGRDGQEGSCCKLRLYDGLIDLRHVPYCEGRGALASSALFCIFIIMSLRNQYRSYRDIKNKL